MPQDWDQAFSLTPGISPLHVFLSVLYLPSKALTDVSSATSQQGGGIGGQLLPSLTDEAAASQFVSTTHQREEPYLPHILTVSSDSSSPRFRRHLPTGTSHLQPPLLALGRHRLQWADGLCVNSRPDIQEHVCILH